MKPRLVLSCSLAALVAVQTANSANLYWDGTGTSWDPAANWSESATTPTPDPAASPGATDTAYFNVTGVTADQNIALGGSRAVGGIVFNGEGGKVTLTGGTAQVLTIGGSGIIANGSTTSPTVATKLLTISSNVAVQLTGSQSWLSNVIPGTGTPTPITSTDGILIQGSVSLAAGAGNSTLTLGGSGSSSTPLNTISGAISDGGGVLSIAMNPSAGTNRWTLSGNNSYSGVTTITRGALTIGNVNALGSTAGGTVVSSGAGLFFRNGVGTMAAETLTLNGTGPDSKGALRNVGGNNTWTGAITLGSATVAVGNDGGNFTLDTGANITTNIASSTLQFVTTSATAISSTFVRGNISGAISVDKGAGAVTLQSPNATVTFSDTAKTYTGSTTVTSGTLVLNTGLTNTSSVTVSTGATLRGTGSINTSAITTVRSGGFLGAGASAGAIGNMSMGALVLEGGSTLAADISSSTGTSDLVTITGNLSIDGANTAILSLGDLAAGTPTGPILFLKYSGVWNGGLLTYNGTVITDNGNSFVVGSNTYQLDYDLVDGSGRALALIAVPEPTGVALLGCTALLAVFRRRRELA